MNENLSICSQCNGKCCKNMPGIVHPDQIKDITVENLTLLLKNGYQFDYWEGSLLYNDKYLQGYYLRPQTLNSLNKVVDPTWGGICVFFEDNKGCALSFNKRPYECQTLLANPTFNCSSDPDLPDLTKLDYAKAWLPYNDIILETIKQNT